MKKFKVLLSLVICLAVALSLACFSMAAEADEHVCEFKEVWTIEEDGFDYVKYACECGESYVEHGGYRCSDLVLYETTCTTDGYTVHYCPVCQTNYVEHLEPKGHNYNAVVTDPTCTEGGYTTYTCVDCNDTYVADEVEANGHNIVAKNEEIIYPTCTEEGLVAYWYCGDCCTYFADAELTTEMEDQTGLNLMIPANGHNIVAKNEEIIYPTCTEDGLDAYWYCGDCCTYFADAELTTLREDQTGMDLVLAATGHNIVAKNEEIIYPTCTEDGLDAYWYCGDCCTYFADAELTTLREDQTGMDLVLAATGHNIVAKNEEIIYPTCTEDGLDAYWYCGDCCTYFADAELTTPMEDQTGMNLAIAATGHNIVAKNEEIIYPTCTEEGLAAYWYCGDCCTYFADAELTTPMEDQTGMNLAIAATGHNIVAKNEAVIEPTCVEEGLVAYWYCGDCCTYFADAELTTEMEDQTGLNLTIATVDHNFVDGVCTVCGAADDSIPSTNDVTTMIYVGIIMVMAMGGVALVARKKALF